MKHIYFGWYVVAASVLVLALVIGSTFAAFSLFVMPVSEEFGLSRADMNTALIVLNLGNAVLAPIIGRLLDRVSARRVMAVSALLLGASLAALGYSDSLMLDVAIMALPLAVGFLGSGPITVTVLIARWFKVYRGRAMALMAIGLSAGGIAVAPAVGWLIASQGWRMALVISGAVAGAALLALSLAMRDRPGPDDVEAPGSSESRIEEAPSQAGEIGLPPSVGSILARPLFWAMAVGVSLGLMVSQAVTVSLVPLGMGHGLTMMQGASIVSVSGIAGIVSMVLLAMVADRFDRSLLLVGLILLGILPNVALMFASSYDVLLVSSVIVGLTAATISPVYIALLADRFGVAAFGTVRGLMIPVISLIGAVGMRFIGEVYDRTGSYAPGFATFIVVDIVAASLILGTWLTRHRSPQRA